VSRHRHRHRVALAALVFVIGAALWVIGDAPSIAEAAPPPTDRSALATGGLRASTEVVPVRMRAPLAWALAAESPGYVDGRGPRHLLFVPIAERRRRTPLYALLRVYRI
jgi:hypothetical protein